MTILSRTLSVASVLCAWASAPTLAQGDAATTHHGQLVMRADAQLGLPLSSGQRPVALAGADKIAAILERDDALASPVGYSVLLHRATGMTMIEGRDVAAPGLPPHYGITGTLSYFFLEGGQVTDHGGRFVFGVMVNGAGKVDDMSGVPMPLDNGPLILRDYRVTGQFRGRPVYNGECVSFARRATPLLVPVTRERAMRLAILKVRADSTRHEAQYRETSGSVSDAYKQWVAERPKRDADMRSSYEAMKKIDANAAQQVLDAYKKAEAQAEAQFKASATGGMDDRIKTLEQQGREAVGEQLRQMQAQLDALSAAEKKAPAAMLSRGIDGDLIVPVDTPDAEPLLQINSAYFDKTVGADVPQVVTVCLPGLQSDIEPARYEWNDRRRRDAGMIRDHLDWAAIEALVKP